MKSSASCYNKVEAVAQQLTFLAAAQPSQDAGHFTRPPNEPAQPTAAGDNARTGVSATPLSATMLV